ncbi:MAG: signal peptidase II [Acidobacteria bacterium]|nr:MAG: signal peptidase II [Acidobacteriota bacterium]
MRKSTYLLISLVVVVLDQWTKWQVEAYLPRHLPTEVIPGFLNLTHVRNTGVAFGLFASQGEPWATILLTILGLAALLVVGLYFWRTPDSDVPLLVALSLILGGAVGNLVDRIANGAVTDFIDVYFGTYHWHTFNIADSAITVGIVLMAVDIFFSPKHRADKAPEPSSGAGGQM